MNLVTRSESNRSSKPDNPASLGNAASLPFPSEPRPIEHLLVFDNLFSRLRFGFYQADTLGNCLGITGAPAGREWKLEVDRQALEPAFTAAMASGRDWSRELCYRSSQGDLCWVQVNVGPLRDGHGRFCGYLGCHVETTPQVEARERRALSEERLGLAVEAAGAGVWDLDLERDQSYFSPLCYRMLGYREGLLPGTVDDWRELIHPEDREAARQAKLACMEGGAPGFRVELRLRTSEGGWSWFLCDGKVARRHANGTALRVVGTLVDIGERKLVEQLLRMERDLMDVITTTSPVGIIFVDRDGAIAFVNPRAEQILGMTREEMMQRRYDLPVCGITGAGVSEELPLREVLEHGTTLPHTCLALKRADGHRALLSLNAAPFLDADGAVGGAVLIMQDVTEQRQHEMELADSDRLLRETQRIAQLGSYILDLADDTWTCSSILIDLLGLDHSSPKTLLDHFESVHPQFRQQYMDSYLACISAGKNFEMEYRVVRRSDGVERWVAECCEPKADETGRLSRMIGTIQDITERKAAEEAIRDLNDELDRRVIERTSQLAAAKKEIESFSYSVSHDLRAPLRHINSYSALLLEDHGDALPDAARSYLDRIRTASCRMGRLIDDLLTLTRVGRTSMKRERFNISSLAAEVINMLKECEGGCEAEFIIEPNMTADGDSILVRVVLENLLGNAVKYSAQRKARIEFGQKMVGGKRAFFVKDQGVGFEMAYAGNLFQPFQRLHGAEFEGTGIGLATVKRIIDRHGGSIWAEGREQQGATFCFTLSGSRAC